MTKTLKSRLPGSISNILNQLISYWRSIGMTNPKKVEGSRGKISPEWRNRIDDVLSCPDNKYIKRVKGAGKLSEGYITMHNGIKVGGLSYYGAGILNMLIESRGVHEPQEERAFERVLKNLPAKSTMLELGAYWGYYSLWFSNTIKDARCFLVEPRIGYLKSGKINFKANGYSASFTQAYIGKQNGKAPDGVKTVSVDSFCRKKGINHLAILHSDIQGAELDMLKGARNMLKGNKVDYVFVSTHSNKLHYQCIELLKSYKYTLLASIDMDETYSVDGLIVAKSKKIKKIKRLLVSKKPKS